MVECPQRWQAELLDPAYFARERERFARAAGRIFEFNYLQNPAQREAGQHELRKPLLESGVQAKPRR